VDEISCGTSVRFVEEVFVESADDGHRCGIADVGLPQRTTAQNASYLSASINPMSSKGKRFIILAFGERGVRYGVNMHGEGSPIPLPLVKLLYSFEPDNGGLGREGCEAFFRYSRRNLRKLERMVAEVEKLRETQFPALGIGLAHGRIGGQHNWLGRLKRRFNPDEETLERALAAVQGPQTYRETLNELHDDAAQATA